MIMTISYKGFSLLHFCAITKNKGKTGGQIMPKNYDGSHLDLVCQISQTLGHNPMVEKYQKTVLSKT